MEYAERFTYLGSVISNDGDAELDVNCRIGKAATPIIINILIKNCQDSLEKFIIICKIVKKRRL